MGEFKYVKELLSSFGEVFKKPILLMPFVYIFVLSTIFLFIMPQQAIVSTDGVVDYNTLVLIIGLGIIQILIGLAFKGMGLVGIRDYVNEEKVTCKNQTLGGLKMFWKLLLLTLLQLIVIAIPVVLLLAIYFGVLALSSVVATIVAVLLIILFIIYVLFALFFLLFSNVVVSYDGKTAKAAIMDSYNYAKQNRSHTIITMITMFLAGLVLFLLLLIIYIPFLISTNPTMAIVQSIVTSVISIPISAAFILYLFKAFNNGMGAGRKLKPLSVVSETAEADVKKVAVAKVSAKKPAKKKKLK